jgi:hypothetical protein
VNVGAIDEAPGQPAQLLHPKPLHGATPGIKNFVLCAVNGFFYIYTSNFKPLTMKKFLLPFTLILAISVSFAFRPDEVHLKGVIEDSTCANSKSQMTPKDSRVTCVKKCLKNGATAVLVVGDKIYKIANQKAVLKYAGEDVSVDGTVTGDTIQVTKIAAEKS